MVTSYSIHPCIQPEPTCTNRWVRVQRLTNVVGLMKQSVTKKQMFLQAKQGNCKPAPAHASRAAEEEKEEEEQQPPLKPMLPPPETARLPRTLACHLGMENAMSKGGRGRL